MLLAGGPDSATTLVANIELCARRHSSHLPAVGQLTLNHLLPLQKFVYDNSCVAKSDPWIYYAVINIPGSALGVISGEHEPLGPHAKGFLMHRRMKEQQTLAFGSGSGNLKQLDSWKPGYFLLK